MAKRIPHLAHSRAAAVRDVRKPFFLQPLFTFLSSNHASSAVRDYRSVLFERLLQNILRVRTARAFLRSLEWHIDQSVRPFLGRKRLRCFW